MDDFGDEAGWLSGVTLMMGLMLGLLPKLWLTLRLGEMSEDDAQPLHRGLAAAHTQGKRTQHGKPQAWSGQG